MARSKEFDPEHVVGSALELFWRQGYANTSMQDLVDHLGIGRGSLYDTFGSKHELWVRALTRYCEEGNRAILDVLEADGPLIPRLHAALVALVEQDLADPDRRGCMLVNAAMETLPADADAAAQAERSFDEIERGFESAIRLAQLDGEVGESVDPAATAAFLLTLMEGLRVVAKATADRRRLIRSIDVAIALLS